MKNLLKCRQNKWSEIGKDFFCKNAQKYGVFDSV